MDARYRRPALVEKVRRIAAERQRICISHDDAEEFMQRLDQDGKKTFFFVDPPYFGKGASLYANHYAPKDHKRVARTVSRLRSPWLLTYDDRPEIERIYAPLMTLRYQLNYSAQHTRPGIELMLSSLPLEATDIRAPLAAA